MNGQDDFAGLGFAEGAVIGARTFKVTDDGWLTGLFYKQRWLPGVNLAQCLQHRNRNRVPRTRWRTANTGSSAPNWAL